MGSLYFDDPLLVRTPQGMAPMPRAAALAEPLAQILDGIGSIVRPQQFDPAVLAAEFRIGMTDNSFFSIGLPFLEWMRTAAPRVKTAFFGLHREQMDEQLAKGMLDAAVIAHVAAPEQLRHTVLYRERFVCAMRQGHPLLEEDWDLDVFCRQDFVLGSFFGGSFSGAADYALEAFGRRRNVAVSVQNFALIPPLLRQSDLLAVLPAKLAGHAEGLAVRELPFAVSGYSKLLVWHERSHADPVQKWLRTQLAQSAQAA